LDCNLPDARIDLLTHVMHVDLSANKLRGPLPASILALPRLLKFSGAHNQLTGQMPCPPPSSQITSLELAR
jgi:hypothetical protein